LSKAFQQVLARNDKLKTSSCGIPANFGFRFRLENNIKAVHIAKLKCVFVYFVCVETTNFESLVTRNLHSFSCDSFAK